MTDYDEWDETDSIVDEAREVISATREEQARIRAFQDNQTVRWDRLSYVDDSDWRSFNGLT